MKTRNVLQMTCLLLLSAAAATADPRIFSPFWVLEHGGDAYLELTSSSAEPRVLRPLLLLEGREEIVLPEIVLLQGETRRVSLREALGRAARSGSWGSVVLEGDTDGIVGWTISAQDASSFVAESVLRRPAYSAAARVVGHWWRPTARTEVDAVVQNVCDTPQQISAARLGEESTAGAAVLAPGNSIRLRLASAHGDAASRAGELPQVGTLDLATVSRDPCLIGQMLLRDRARGFSIATDLSAPETRLSTTLHLAGGPAGRPGEAWGFPASASFSTYLVVANLSEERVEVRPTAYGSGKGTRSAFVDLEPVHLRPGETRLIGLSDAATWAHLPRDGFRSLTVRHTGAPSALSAVAYTVDESLSFSLPCPLVDAERRLIAKPVVAFDLSTDRTTLLIVRNTAEFPVEFSFALTYFEDGALADYWAPKRELGPSELTVINLKELRNSQRPGQRGEVLPTDLVAGSAVVAAAESGVLLVADPTIDRRIGTVKLCDESCVEPEPYGNPTSLPEPICAQVLPLPTTIVTVIPPPVLYTLVRNTPLSNGQFRCEFTGCFTGLCGRGGPTMNRSYCPPGLNATSGVLATTINFLFISVTVCDPLNVVDLLYRPC